MRRRSFWIAAPVGVVTLLAGLGATRLWEKSAGPRTGGVVALGDSITYGAGLSRGHDYPSQLSELVSAPVWNAGVSGDKAADAHARLAPLLARYRPKAVVVLIGTNDAGIFSPATPLPAFTESLEAIIYDIRGVPATPLVCSLLPVDAASLADDGLSARRWDDYDSAVRDVAEATATSLVDLHRANQGRLDLFLDGLHPNRQGSAVIARAVADALISAGLTTAAGS